MCGCFCDEYDDDDVQDELDEINDELGLNDQDQDELPIDVTEEFESVEVDEEVDAA